ncbi:MAG: 16S rRNA processing protein RimM [Deltaproteobacteria bacterium]|nr:16S rRNA processing protein RimM [Deltaproteobacteria bacterium]
MEEPRLIAVGRIVRTHGVRGEVKLYPYGDSMASLGAGETLLLERKSGHPRETLTLVSRRAQGRMWIVRFRELEDRDEAQELAGREILLPEDRLPPTQEGEYYHYQLLGLEVVTREGIQVGILRGILETGSHDVYAVECHGREALIPAVDDVICEIDLKQNRMVIDPPEGLLDDL